MPYEILEPEPKGYEVLEPEVEDRDAKRQDLIRQMAIARGEGEMGRFTSGLLSIPEAIAYQIANAGAKVDPAGVVRNMLQRTGYQPTGPIVPPEVFKPDVSTVSQFVREGLGNMGINVPEPVRAGGEQFVAEQASGLTDPGVIVPGATAKTLPRDIGRMFQAQMLSALPENIMAYQQAASPEEKVRTGLGLAANVALPAVIELGISRTPAKAETILPRAAAEAEKGVTENAIQERGATEIPVGETPGDRGKVVEGTPGAKEPAIPQGQEEVPRTEAGSGRLLLTDKEKEIQARIPRLTDESLRITVSRDPALPAADYVQVDEVPGDKFSSNPETLRKLGYEMPSSAELLKLPRGQYTLAQAREMLKKTEPPATGQERILLRQFGDLPKGTVVTLTGEKSLDPINQWVGVKLPSGEIAHISPASISAKELPIRSLPQLLGELGEEKLGNLISYWDQNAELSPDKKTIIGVQDPRNPTAKARLSTRDFIKWLSSDEGIEAQAALKKAEPPPPVTGEVPRQSKADVMTIYRAGDADEVGVKKWSAWTPDEATAIAYQDNPGFGGRTLRVETVPRGLILDANTTSLPGMIDLAEKLGLSRKEGEKWWDAGYRYPWEETVAARKALDESGYDWIRYEDDFPEGATTIVALKDFEHGAIPKAEPPAATPQTAPRQPVPTGAAPEGERAPAVSAAEPPGTTKGDISTAKEQVPVPIEQLSPREMLAKATADADLMASMAEHLKAMRTAMKQGSPISAAAARSYQVLPEIVKAPKPYRYDPTRDMFVPAESRMAVSKDAWKTIAGLDALDLRQKQVGETPAIDAERTRLTAKLSQQLGFNPPTLPSPGPGAKTVGEPPYSAAQLLTDQLKATPPTGTKEGLSLREKIADKWAQGKTLFERAFGTGRAISESLKETARGVRDITDLDRRVGELDYLLQRSSGLSKNMKKAILQQQPNKATREAVALWIDAGGDVNRLRDTLAKLPPKTAPSVRRALERAINLPPEAVQFAEGLKQFYGIRLNDAQQAGVFEKFLDDYYTHVWQKPSNMPEDLRAHYSTGRVSDYFQFARQRSIPTFLDGILQGMKPILDPAEVLPGYNYALDRAIASRKFVKELSEINAPDGRPAVLPTGTAQRVEGDTGGMFINPKGKGELGKDYHVIDHPAMRKWKWMGTDENGNPVMYRSDLAANPGVHERLARMLDQRLATPSKWGRRLLRASTEVKGLKLGLLSAFHQVHVGSHALWHWTNPFKTAEINWDAPSTRFAIEKGHLKIAGDAADIANFAEGLVSPGLVHKIPIVGPWSKAYSEWLFTVYIPQLKLKTFNNAYARNLKYYAKDIQAGKITTEQVAARVGDAVNNAYGELNHWFLGKYGRSPQFQRILRGVFLAPDFGEARLRFTEKALTRFGMEERMAFATMIGTMYLAARVGNWLSHGDPELDIKNAFRVKVGKEWVSMRSVAGDLLHAITNFGQFMYVRLNPLYSRTISDVLFQRDVYGRKLSMGDILLKRPAQQLVPINLTGLTREDQKLWESAITSMGLQVQHDVPAMDIGKLKRQWLLKNPDPKLRAMGERSEQELFPPSDYSKLRRALIDNDMAKAKAEYESLQKDKGKKHTDIVKALSPISGGRIVNGRYVDTKVKPIGGEIGYGNEQKFRASLTPAERKLYLQALAERKLIFDRFRSMLAGAK